MWQIRIVDRIEKILIIKLRGIGDVVLSTAVIPNLRRAFPGADIHFLTEQESAEAVQGLSGIDDVLVFDRRWIQSLPWHRAAVANLRFLRRIRRQGYDLVFDLFGNPRSALFSWVSGARHRVGYDFRVRKWVYTVVARNRGDRVHEVEFNLDALAAVGVPIVERSPSFPLDAAARRFAENFLARELEGGEPLIALNPSGGWWTKRWPLERFAALGDRLAEELGARILVLWGPGELEEARSVAQAMANPPLLPPATTLKQLAALLERCQLVISNDSGPMHIAAAVGTPTLGIFGPTVPALQGPYGDGHAVVSKEGLDCLGCNGLTCRIGTHDCMRNLNVEEVFTAAAALVRQKPMATVPSVEV
jgi:lipopolysaccharide heptosyltransferase II